MKNNNLIVIAFVLGIIIFLLIAAFFITKSPLAFFGAKEASSQNNPQNVFQNGSDFFSDEKSFLPNTSMSNQSASFEEINGFIVEFNEDPILVKKANKEKEISDLKSMGKFFEAKAKENNLGLDLVLEKNKLKENQLVALNDISSKLGKNGITNKKDSSDKSKLRVGKKFTGVFNGAVLYISSSEAKKVKESSFVKNIFVNSSVSAVLTQSVPQIGADKVWQLTDSNSKLITGKGISVAVIDTGVDYTHPDFGACTTQQFLGGNCLKVKGGYDFINSDNDPIDDMGHGTHVASIIAGNGSLKGVAPDATIYSYKVLNSLGYGSSSHIISAIELATDPNQDGNYSDHIDIISMSLGAGGANPDDPMSIASDNAVSAGVVVVAAAGNNGPGEQTINSPGTSRKAITVGAVDKSDSLAAFSSRGFVNWLDANGTSQTIIKPDLVAPGVSICAAGKFFYSNGTDISQNLRCNSDNLHISLSGTSMATPHISGVIALMKQAHPSWTPLEIKSTLKNFSKKIVGGINEIGFGRVDALKGVSSSKPAVADISRIDFLSGDKFSIRGSAYSTEFSNYKLYYSYSLTGTWNEIYSSNLQVNNGVLYNNFDYSYFYDGPIFLKLVVTRSDGNTFLDYYIVILNKFGTVIFGDSAGYLFSPQIPVYSNIPSDSNFSKYRVNFFGEMDSAWQTFCDTNKIIYNLNSPAYICTGNFSQLSNGKTYFMISGLKNGVWYEGKEVLALVLPNLVKGWPVKIGFGQSPPRHFGGPIVFDIDSDKKNELIFGNSIIYSDRSTKSLSGGPFLDLSLFDDTVLVTQSPNYVIKKKLIGPDYDPDRGFIFAYDSNGDYVGQVDIDSNNGIFLTGGMLSNKNEVYVSIIKDCDYWIGYEAGTTFRGCRDSNYYYGIKKISLKNTGHGLNYTILDLNLPPNKYPGVHLFANNLAIITDKNGDAKRIAQLDYSVYSPGEDGQISAYTLSLEVFNPVNGALIKRTLIMDTNNVSTAYQGERRTFIFSADIDKDSSSEWIVISDNWQYPSFLTVIGIFDENGNQKYPLIQKSGGYLYNSIIHSIDSRPVILLARESTTSFNSPAQLIAVDYYGNTLFNKTFSEVSQVSGLLSYDVDSDFNKEIIVTTSPYYLFDPNWTNLSVKVLSQNGDLKSELSLPSLHDPQKESEEYTALNPAIGDIDGDKNSDIVLVSIISNWFNSTNSAQVYLMKLGGKLDSNNNWAGYSHDFSRSNCYSCNSSLTYSLHPADTGSNFDITPSEYLAFGNCLRTGCSWPGLGSVSSSWYLNAANILRTGPKVYHSVGAGCPPSSPGNCWQAGS